VTFRASDVHSRGTKKPSRRLPGSPWIHAAAFQNAPRHDCCPCSPQRFRDWDRPRSRYQLSKHVCPVIYRLLLCLACPLHRHNLKSPSRMPTESFYPSFEVPELGLWDFLFERKDREFPDDKGEHWCRAYHHCTQSDESIQSSSSTHTPIDHTHTPKSSRPQRTSAKA
jgi:hypothetical protein